MDIGRLREFIAGIDTTNPNNIDMRLIEKSGSGLNSYVPQLNLAMRQELQAFYSEVLNDRFFDKDQAEYNPNIAVEDTLQYSNLETAHINEVINDIDTESNCVYDIGEINLENLNYYRFKFINGNEELYIFRRFTKMKKIRNGIFGIIQDNTFNRLEDRSFFGIDRDIDILVFGGEVLIVNKFALQTIFKLNDYFQERADEALNRLNEENIFENFSEFHDDCLGDKIAARKMTKIINEGLIDGFIQNIERLSFVIQRFDLDFELNGDNKIIYDRTRNTRNQILSCISDAYYRSVMLQRYGEDPS